LLDAPWLARKRILMLEPRRLAARNAAMHMAELLGEAVGETVGYRVRFEAKVGPKTRIEVLTEGLLARRLQADPELSGVGLVIFDEFHERHLESDKALALCLDSQAALRDDLRLLVMSATLELQGLGDLLGAPLLESEGRAWPVTTHHLPQWQEAPLGEAVARGVLHALGETQEGDLLAFLPGVGEIRVAEGYLQGHLSDDVVVTPLYGELPFATQQHAIRPDPLGRRKVVLTTAIAESSLTIDGVRVVVDGGYSRVPSFDPRSALTQLQTVRVTRAGAEQRRGRAGRLGPGVCYRLWGEGVERGLVPHPEPEIASADLAPLALDLAQWGVTDPLSLRWFTPPPLAHYAQAVELLQALDALDLRGRITAHGRAMAALPLHPRLAHMLVHARERGEGALACLLAALISERSPLPRQRGEANDDLHQALEACLTPKAVRGPVDRNALRRIEQAAQQFARLLDLRMAPPTHADPHALAELLALAYPDRVAQRRDTAGLGYRLANGKGALLHEGSVWRGERWLVIAELGGGAGREPLIRTALPIAPSALERLFATHLAWRHVVEWRGERLLAERRLQLGALVLSSEPLPTIPAEALAEAWLTRLRRDGLGLLGWGEASTGLRERVRTLHLALPEQAWPDWSDAALLEGLERWLLPWLDGVRSLDQLARLDLHAIFSAELGWERQQQLERLAPSHWPVASGSRIRIDYSGERPVLAVKLQELFGTTETPAIADGRLPLTLHLLSPARRPIQVTQDLVSFWANTYAEVKKELKGRYPKHPWPDDPLTAVATAKTKRALARDQGER